ncbi:hypothetical protein GGI15_003843, partial [Coemansia interrupta]
MLLNHADTKGGNTEKTETATYKIIIAVIEEKVNNQAKVMDDTNPETIPDSDSKEVSKDVMVKDASLAKKYPNLWAGGIVRQTGSDGNSEDDTTDRIFAPLDKDVLKTIPLRVHRRLAMEPLGEPLRTAKVVDETIIAIADAMEVYKAAWKNHWLMHRNISTCNILICRDTTTGEFLNGALIDFDCAIMENNSNTLRTNQRPNITGIFLFMS